MSATRLGLNDFLSQSHNHLLIDVRSPAEYAHAHIPGAYNIPLFDNEERKVVGTIYKQKSREEAIKEGLDFFGPKMRQVIEAVETFLTKERVHSIEGQALSSVDRSPTRIFVYCWRGGMRSAAISWLLDLYGFNVSVLSGGYKTYRNYVLKSFEQPWVFKVLGGYTGSGKTEVLDKLKKEGKAVVDLEALAIHKGSAFGNIDLPPQPSQEQFENLLATELNKQNIQQSIWLEDESQRIGNINIPGTLWQTIRQSPLYFIDVPFKERLLHIVEEYGQLDKEQMAAAILRISKRLGGLETKNAIQYLEEGNFHDCFSILLSYYDKHYYKSLNNRENLSLLLKEIKCHKVGAANFSYLLNQSLA